MIVILALPGGLRQAWRQHQRDRGIATTGSSPSLPAIPDTVADGDGLV